MEYAYRVKRKSIKNIKLLMQFGIRSVIRDQINGDENVMLYIKGYLLYDGFRTKHLAIQYAQDYKRTFQKDAIVRYDAMDGLPWQLWVESTNYQT